MVNISSSINQRALLRSKSPVSKSVTLEVLPHFPEGRQLVVLVRLVKGSCSLPMALRLVSCRSCTSFSSDLLTLPTFSRWRWQTLRSSRSCSFTSAISLFLAMMKLISALASCSCPSARAASWRLSSSCSQRARHFSFSLESSFTFSRISFSSRLRSSSLEAMWNCSSWQSFSLFCTSPWLIETAVSSSEMLPSSLLFSSSRRDSVSLRLVSSRIRLRMQLCVLQHFSLTDSPCARMPAFSRRPFSTSSRTCPSCSRVRSSSIFRASARPFCSWKRMRASVASSSLRFSWAMSCWAANLASLRACARSRSSSSRCSACSRSSQTLRADSSSRSWFPAHLASWSRSSPSCRARALPSSSFARSYFYWLLLSDSTSPCRLAITAFFWSMQAEKSSVVRRSVALLALRMRLMFYLEIGYYRD